jgi:hypothetical protein
MFPIPFMDHMNPTPKPAVHDNWLGIVNNNYLPTSEL